MKQAIPFWIGHWVLDIRFLLNFLISLSPQLSTPTLPYGYRNAVPVSTLPNSPTSQIPASCSQQTIEVLTTQLLRDLPSYANRTSQRARRLARKGDTFSYMVLAGRPEFTPLPLSPVPNSSDIPKKTSEEVVQVFFTTLERQYTAGKMVELQQFHRLFVTKSKNGWQMVMMFSQTGSYPVDKRPPTPPRDSSNSNIAQGINAWLRDCQSGNLRIQSGK
jgi:nucleoid DNA-binding protein